MPCGILKNNDATHYLYSVFEFCVITAGFNGVLTVSCSVGIVLDMISSLVGLCTYSLWNNDRHYAICDMRP